MTDQPSRPGAGACRDDHRAHSGRNHAPASRSAPNANAVSRSGGTRAARRRLAVGGDHHEQGDHGGRGDVAQRAHAEVRRGEPDQPGDGDRDRPHDPRRHPSVSSPHRRPRDSDENDKPERTGVSPRKTIRASFGTDSVLPPPRAADASTGGATGVSRFRSGLAVRSRCRASRPTATVTAAGEGLGVPLGLVAAGPDGDPPVGVPGALPLGVGLAGELVRGWADGLVDGFLPPECGPRAGRACVAAGARAGRAAGGAGAPRRAVRRDPAGGGAPVVEVPAGAWFAAGVPVNTPETSSATRPALATTATPTATAAPRLPRVPLRLVRLTLAGGTGGTGGPRHARRHVPLVRDVGADRRSRPGADSTAVFPGCPPRPGRHRRPAAGARPAPRSAATAASLRDGAGDGGAGPGLHRGARERHEGAVAHRVAEPGGQVGQFPRVADPLGRVLGGQPVDQDVKLGAGRRRAAAGSGRYRWAAITSAAVPSCGGTPVRHSCSTMPSAYRSLAAVPGCRRSAPAPCTAWCP